MGRPSLAERERTLELLNAEVENRLVLQAASTTAIDTKASFLVGFSAIALQVFLGLDREQPWATLAFGSFLLALVFGLLCLRIRRYKAVPEPTAVRSFYDAHSDDETMPNLREHVLATLVSTKTDALSANAKIDKGKSRWWWAAAVCFVAAVMLSIVSVVR